jgi:DUF4097 and DUF4098 domain-containing protein YvlB
MSRAFRWLVVGLGCLIVVALVSGRGFRLWSHFAADETVEESFVVGATPQVVIETFNGQIEVHTGLAGKVTATVTKRATGLTHEEAESDLDNIDVQFLKEADTVRVTARRIGGNSDNSAAVKLYVPPGASLDLRTRNAGIEVNGPTGAVVARSSNGQIHVAGSQGEVHLQTSNGRIRIDADPSLVEARTSNGRIEFNGRLGNGDHIFETSNGRVALNLPSDSAFQFEARTSNGRVINKFPTRTTEKKTKRQMSGQVGQPSGCRVTIRTSNSNIQIQPQESAAEDDDDD